MRIRINGLVGIAAMLLGSVSAWAHHSFAAEFDSGKPVKLQGTIVKVEFINPHTWIHVDVKDSEGKVAHWMLEGGSPNALFRRGASKSTFPIGAAVVVEGFQAKDGSNFANARDITFADGRKFSVGGSNPDEQPNH